MVRFPQVSLQQVLLTAFEQAVGPFVKRMGLRRRTAQAKNRPDDFLKFP
jgi:hypothetical protein